MTATSLVIARVVVIVVVLVLDKFGFQDAVVCECEINSNLALFMSAKTKKFHYINIQFEIRRSWNFLHQSIFLSSLFLDSASIIKKSGNYKVPFRYLAPWGLTKLPLNLNIKTRQMCSCNISDALPCTQIKTSCSIFSPSHLSKYQALDICYRGKKKIWFNKSIIQFRFPKILFRLLDLPTGANPTCIRAWPWGCLAVGIFFS